MVRQGTDALDQTDLSGNLTNEYVFLGGKRIARRNVSSTVFYYFEDHLGTSRVISSATGTVCYDADFYPSGRERIIANTCSQHYKFTGKERDSETGNDDFGAHYYSSSVGRFLIADWSAVPAPIPYANLANPQTLNLYAYAENNPLRYIDPTGHGAGWPLGSGPDPSAMGPVFMGHSDEEPWSNFGTVEHQVWQDGRWVTVSTERMTAQEFQDNQGEQQREQQKQSLQLSARLTDGQGMPRSGEEVVQSTGFFAIQIDCAQPFASGALDVTASLFFSSEKQSKGRMLLLAEGLGVSVKMGAQSTDGGTVSAFCVGVMAFERNGNLGADQKNSAGEIRFNVKDGSGRTGKAYLQVHLMNNNQRGPIQNAAWFNSKTIFDIP